MSFWPVRVVRLGLAALMLGAGPVQRVDVHNLMPAFWQAWGSTQGQPEIERVKQFKELVIMPNLAVYADGEFEPDFLSDAKIAEYLRGLEVQEPALRALSDSAAKELPGDLVNIETQLPDLSLAHVHFYILPSFEHFDGQTHDLGNDIGVFLGIDGILAFHGVRASVGVTVAHELFHIYQYETHPDARVDNEPLWEDVWGEGSAAYASEQLTKGATQTAALGAALAHATPEEVKSLACFVQSHWDGHSKNDVARLLDAGQHLDGLPARGGYLIGYLVARDFAKTHTLAEIGAAKITDVEPVFKASVDRLCSVGM